jgi:uncharacterized protein YqhQ
MTSAWPAPPVLRVGGMAFGNGVLMRSKRYWAWARDDGSVIHGPVTTVLDSSRVLRVPVLRSAVAFVEMILFTVARHRQNGRQAGMRVLLWLGAYVAVCLGMAALLPALHQDGLVVNAIVQVLALALGMAALRFGMGADVWRYHGAEHKAVNAFEAGVQLDDTAEVMRHSRIHERCGTNLMVIVLALMLAYLPLQNVAMAQAAGGVYTIVAVAVAFELFRFLSRRPRAWITRLVLIGGKSMQRWFTTREPSPCQLELACAALGRVVELEATDAELVPS